MGYNKNGKGNWYCLIYNCKGMKWYTFQLEEKDKIVLNILRAKEASSFKSTKKNDEIFYLDYDATTVTT